MPKVLAFMLMGKVQGVKMRRYVESAARHFGLSGYVINTSKGHVFGEAWERRQQQCTSSTTTENDDDDDDNGQEHLDQFLTWIRGQWQPAVYHNIKPTPIGTAYPEKARVHRCATVFLEQQQQQEEENALFDVFAMVRNDEQAEKLALRRLEIQMRLESDRDASVETCAWPEP